MNGRSLEMLIGHVVVEVIGSMVCSASATGIRVKKWRMENHNAGIINGERIRCSAQARQAAAS